MQTTSKGRTPSRCREWERQRRNKFNEAISKLGEVVKTIYKASNGKDCNNAQYPKIEIIEKATLCLTTVNNEKMQLKAEILAMQVRLESKSEKKDVSTQVSIKKRKGKKETIKKSALFQKPHKSLPKLLPKCNINKKGTENFIMVLPAAPYLYPPRPMLYPTTPPAIVLLEPNNMKTINKPTVPIVNKNNGDVTKTTTVNILPISAYSRPLSVRRAKKVNKSKNISKKKEINAKEVNKVPKNCNAKPNSTANQDKENGLEKNCCNKVIEELNTGPVSVKEKTILLEREQKSVTATENADLCEKEETLKANLSGEEIKNALITSDKNENKSINTNDSSTNSLSVVESKETEVINKIPSPKDSVLKQEKEKEMLPNILNSTLCENVVDAGNARLELAEEFLAASPTAAFLMSFPLVSGNRADSPAEEANNPSGLLNKQNREPRQEMVQHKETCSENEGSNHEKSTRSDEMNLNSSASQSKDIEPVKFVSDNVANKQIETKPTGSIAVTNVSENPFLNYSMPSLISTSCTMADSTFNLDFDCSINKSISSTATNYVNNSNLFYKGDPFSGVKNTIYSTSSMTSGHEFNGLSLYPCAMEKYTSKNKSEYPNVEDNLMKIGASRLTYDIDLGWSHKGLDFVSSTTTGATFSKDSIITTPSTPFSSTYNPFNPEFHVPFVPTSNKKETVCKVSSSISDSISNFYAQPTHLWSEEMTFYNNNISRSLPGKYQNYESSVQGQTNSVQKTQPIKHCDTKHPLPEVIDTSSKSTYFGVRQQNMSSDSKFTKKSPSKTHINWMTSEIRQNSCNTVAASQNETKEYSKSTFSQHDQNICKKQDNSNGNGNFYSVPNHSSYLPQTAQDEFQVWPTARTLGTTEITIEPPPINLPTLVGDLALGPHEKKRSLEIANKSSTNDMQNCGNFLSVTQLMNRTTDNASRYPYPVDMPKINVKHNGLCPNDSSRKNIVPRVDNIAPLPGYAFNSDIKTANAYDVNQFQINKSKAKVEKNTKNQKNNYSAESLIRGATCTQKSNNAKFGMTTQKYNDFHSAQDTGIAQVSHFGSVLDYSENNYPNQQFSSTTFYNSTTNTISNSFYSNFMPSSNLMSGNYASGALTSDFIDYNQSECTYSNHAYDESKMKGISHQERVPLSYKSSRKEGAAKHKLDCSKKESNKKYNKRPKTINESEDWPDTNHSLWQNKTPSKRFSNLTPENLAVPNYFGNQMGTQYHSEFFNSHVMPSNIQTMGQNIERALATNPPTSRTNFNLSTIFPEITMIR